MVTMTKKHLQERQNQFLKTASSLRNSDIALFFGVERGAITLMAQQGCPKNEDDTYDLRKVVSWKIARDTDTGGDEMRKEEIRKKRADATLAEMKIAEACGRLVERGAILRGVREHITTASKMIQDMDKDLARFVPQESRQSFVQAASVRIAEVLKTLADSGISDNDKAS